MQKIVLAAALLLMTPFLMASSCNKDKSCRQAICTAIFASVMVKVETSQGVPVQLDEVYTIRKSTGEKITPSQTMAEGRYSVLDDSYKDRMANRTDEFRFIGKKGGQIVVDETYIISADCCHVKKETGKDTIIAQ
jgi:hypothetical protein